jgi:alcohol dehydrogenase class IV
VISVIEMLFSSACTKEQYCLRLSDQCGMPSKRSELKILCDELEDMAESAMTVTRVLKNNLREITYNDALAIYRSARQYV